MEAIVPSLGGLFLQPDKLPMLMQQPANTKGKRQQKAGDRPKKATTEAKLTKQPGKSTKLRDTGYEQSASTTGAAMQPNGRLEKQPQLWTETQQMAESEKICRNGAAEIEDGQEYGVFVRIKQLTDKLEKMSALLTTPISENQRTSESIVPSLRELGHQPDKPLMLTQQPANTKGKRQQKAGDRPEETTTEAELTKQPGKSTKLRDTGYEQSSRTSEKIFSMMCVHDVMNQLADKLEKLSADLTTSILENQWGTSECQRQLMSVANSFTQKVEEFSAKITELLEYKDGETDDSFSKNDRVETESDSDCSERSIPSRLEVQIDDLCKQVGVSGYSLHQNAEKETAIEIFGIDVEAKLETGLKKIRENWKAYELTTRNQIHDGNSIYTHQFVDSGPVFGEYGIKARKWKCGLIVKARDRNNQTAVFAVGPAHMLFNEERNRDLQDGRGLDEERVNVRHNPPEALYVVQFTINEGEGNGHLQDDHTVVAYVEKGSGPLLGYRYRTEPNANAVSFRSFLNDVVLLRLHRQDAIRINERLEKNTPRRRPQLVNIYETRNGQGRREVLKEYVFCNGKKIKVRNDYGKVVANRFSVRRQTELGKPFRLMFKLDSGKLVKGDSGLIVYEVRYDEDDTELLYPLAMVVGSPNEAEGYEEGVYKAAFLQQAFDDIEHAYSNEPAAALTRIEPYSRSTQPTN